MNRIVASVGLVALGAASVHQAHGEGPAAKWWSVSGTVRGFYDDNVNTAHNPGSADRVWGFEVSPSVGIRVSNDQTQFRADYTYSYLQYDKTPVGNTQKYDQDHTFGMFLDHAFSERYHLRVRDSFVIGQQPDTLRTGAAYPNPYRAPGNNIVNSGGINFEAQLTPLFGIEVGYDNAFFDYKDDGTAKSLGDIVLHQNNTFVTNNVQMFSPSLSAMLDRIEQTAHFDTRWIVTPETMGVFGYSFRDVSYTGDATIGRIVVGPVNSATKDQQDKLQTSDSRNNRSHEVHVGVDHTFTPTLVGSIRAGGAYYDYYNPPVPTTSWGPRANAVLTYTYSQDSTIVVGIQEDRTASDLVQSGGVAPRAIRDTETTVGYLAINHRIFPHLYGGLKATAQNASYNGGGTGPGGFDGKTEQFYTLGADLEYRFNGHFSAHAGYDFDRLDSDISKRSYTRNKVYIGVTGSY